MGQSLRAVCGMLAVAVAMAACDVGGESSGPERATSSPAAPTTSRAETVEIQSSLEPVSQPVLGERGVLPRRVRWIVTPSLPPEKIREVSFLIDGRRVWSDSDPPYTSGEEGARLATSYFYDAYSDRRGGQRFTAEVIGWNAASWFKTVVARVPKPQIKRNTPTFGIWSRLSAADLRNPPPPGKVLEYSSYTSHLYFPGRGALLVGRSVERAYAYELSADAKAFHIGVPIFMGSHDVAGNSFGWRFKGSQCASDGPPATYAWSYRKGRYAGRFDGRDQYHTYLVLKARDEPCEPRRRILEGTWELVD